MTYRPHSNSLSGAPRREYAPHPHAPMASAYHDASTHVSHPQRSFAPPRLPAPRTLPLHAGHYDHRETQASRSVQTEPHRMSTRDDRIEGYGERRSMQGDGRRFSVDMDPRARQHGHPDEATMRYAPPPPSAYSRVAGESSVDMRRMSFGRDPSGQAEASYRSHDADRSHGEPDLHPHQRIAYSHGASAREAAFASSPASYPDPRSEHFQTHHNHTRLHPEMLQQVRRPSVHTFASQPSDADYRRAEPSCAAAPTPQFQPARKRSFAFEHQADLEAQSHSALSRPYPSSGPAPQHPHDYRPPQPRHSVSAATPLPANRLHERPFNEHDASSQPTVRQPLTALDAVIPTHARPSVIVDTVDLSAHSSELSISSQHPLQPNRKRLRISRACDECRRRKTRCDIVGAFPGEPGHPLTISGAVPPLEPNMEPKGEMLILQPCINCRRSEVTCSYSKRPLKRGPSKGYIKDLERRLNSLESQFVSGERADAETEEHAQDFAFTPAPNTSTVKPKIRTEDRISRLESVFARPSTAKSEENRSTSDDSSRRNSGADKAQVKVEAQGGADLLASIPESVAPPAVPDTMDSDVATLASALSSDTGAVSATDTAPSSVTPKSTPSPDPARVESEPIISKTKSKGKAKRRPAADSPLRTPDDDSAEVKDKIVSSCLHATFPIVPARSEAESSRTGSSSASIARLEDKVLARGLRLLTEPVEMVPVQQDSQTPKTRAHAARVASLIGQASAGLGGPRDELMQQARAGTDDLRAIRKVAHRLSGQEADLLMLCHLDHLRNGRNNNSALAAAVSKLGSGSHVQNDRETYRRRTLLFMLDRWHAVAFGTPHLLMGRFGMERHSFRSMKEALGDVSQSALGDAVHEVLRCAIMLGQLNDLVQNNAGWKGISKSDVDAVIHSAMDDDERPITFDPVDLASTDASSSSSTQAEDASPKLLSTEALRYSLESLVRCYHALHTLPTAKNATMDDLHRIFNLAEAVLVLGTAKTPISLQGKLIRSAIGPHVLAVAGVAFSWCLRIICMMVATSLSPDRIAAPALAPSTSKDRTAVPVSPSSFPLEFYRRKILDYVRMCGPFCLFSGGPPSSPASFAPVYLRLALYFNSTVSLASQLGSLVSPQSQSSSPVHQDAKALGNEADTVLDMAREMGFLGYVLAGTTQADAWRLLTGTAA